MWAHGYCVSGFLMFSLPNKPKNGQLGIFGAVVMKKLKKGILFKEL